MRVVNADPGFDALLNLLPSTLSDAISKYSCEELIDIQLDLGKHPKLRYKDGYILIEEEVVTTSTLLNVTKKLQDFNRFNRQGMPGTLNRISCIRNVEGTIVGLTMRLARELTNLHTSIEDFLDTNILLVGIPGSGKSSCLRCIAHELSTVKNREVIIVDKTNEIAGYSDVPHPIVGLSRRIQVRDDQAESMLEAVENHTPHVIIVDEIRDRNEAASAKTIVERGVQLIATCHGKNFLSVVRNPVFNQLLGGIKSATLGDDTAADNGTNKNVLQRESFPSFDTVVELIDYDEVAIYSDVAKVVDHMLRGEEVQPTILRKINGVWIVIQHAKIKQKEVHAPAPVKPTPQPKKRR